MAEFDLTAAKQARKAIRSCLGCGRKKEQTELLRLALKNSADGGVKVVWDGERILAGRGAWLCKNNRECLVAALKKKAFARAFKSKAQLDFTELKADSNR